MHPIVYGYLATAIQEERLRQAAEWRQGSCGEPVVRRKLSGRRPLRKEQ